ncbi:MAG: hypothetical protein ABIQ52_05710 [Vicinamibacterales bacterium]
MDTVLTAPTATVFEAFSGIVAALTYIIVGVVVFARAPHDVRARLFLATGLTAVAPYAVPFIIWTKGAGAALALPVLTLVAVSLVTGSLVLFHFSQTFPWRRPWLRAHARWLYAGYVVLPAMVAAVVPVLKNVFDGLAAADATGAVSVGIAEGLGLVLLLVVLPLVFVAGVVMPCAAIYSLYQTWLAAREAGQEGARVTTYWILASQMAGGVLAVLIIPALRVVAPSGPWLTGAAVLLAAFSLLMPLAFAVGVWKYRVLDLPADDGPPVSRPA